jgi:hypothetical protein
MEDDMRQDYQVVKKYFAKACDLGEQTWCEAYKGLNAQGY